MTKLEEEKEISFYNWVWTGLIIVFTLVSIAIWISCSKDTLEEYCNINEGYYLDNDESCFYNKEFFYYKDDLQKYIVKQFYNID